MGRKTKSEAGKKSYSDEGERALDRFVQCYGAVD